MKFKHEEIFCEICKEPFKLSANSKFMERKVCGSTCNKVFEKKLKRGKLMKAATLERRIGKRPANIMSDRERRVYKLLINAKPLASDCIMASKKASESGRQIRQCFNQAIEILIEGR